jgi:uncharacterized protein YqgQ
VDLCAQVCPHKVKPVDVSLAAMDDQARRSMLTNMGNLVAFRSGADDVELLQREFAGLFRPEILMALDIGECVVKEEAKRPRIVRLPHVH